MSDEQEQERAERLVQQVNAQQKRIAELERLLRKAAGATQGHSFKTPEWANPFVRKSEVVQLKRERDEAQGALAKANACTAQQEVELVEARARIAELEMHLKVTQLSELVKKNRIAELERERDGLRRRCNYMGELERERDEALGRIAELESELEAWREACNRYDESVMRLSAEVSSLRRGLAAAESERDEAREQRDALENGAGTRLERDKWAAAYAAQKAQDAAERITPVRWEIRRSDGLISHEVHQMQRPFPFPDCTTHAFNVAGEEICPCELEGDDPGPHIASCPWNDPDYDAEETVAEEQEPDEPPRVCKSCRFYSTGFNGNPLPASPVCLRYLSSPGYLDPAMVEDGKEVPDWCPGWVARDASPVMSIRIPAAPADVDSAEQCAVCNRAMYADDLRACPGQDDPGGPCVPVSVAKARGWA